MFFPFSIVSFSLITIFICCTFPQYLTVIFVAEFISSIGFLFIPTNLVFRNLLIFPFNLLANFLVIHVTWDPVSTFIIISFQHSLLLTTFLICLLIILL